jgi:hypothetical protein
MSAAHEDDGYIDALLASVEAEEMAGAADTVAEVVPIRPSSDPAQRRLPGESWKPVDLTAVLSGDYQTPEPEIGDVEGNPFGLFYSGRINSVFGDSGSGKSWLLAFVISQVIKAGRDALVIDYEDSPASLAARLQQVGLTTEQIIAHLVYVSPQERWDLKGASNLLLALEGRSVAVAVIDSTGEGMAQDGINPNADEEVAKWFQGAARTLATTGAAVVLIDHVVKSRESGRNSEFASGSQRKRAAINGAAYFLEAVVSPSRDRDGLLKVVVRKDRFGWRQHGSTAAEIKMVNGDDGSVEMTATQPASGSGDPWKPETLMRRVCDALTDAAGPLSRAAIKKTVTGKGQYVDVAIENLLADGNCTQAIGERGAKLVTLVRHMDEDLVADDGVPF